MNGLDLVYDYIKENRTSIQHELNTGTLKSLFDSRFKKFGIKKYDLTVILRSQGIEKKEVLRNIPERVLNEFRHEIPPMQFRDMKPICSELFGVWKK